MPMASAVPIMNTRYSGRYSPPTTTLLVNTSGGLMSKLLPVQMSSAACWNRNAKPTVSSTCRSGSNPSGRRKIRSISRPTAAIDNAATGSASAHDPVVQITDSAT